ncbi:hypothetical protein GH721_05890 [Kriegella sp. EG-1]|nr:hypothetical protein [Flavobacteriaceae bacterium EG-1]
MKKLWMLLVIVVTNWSYSQETDDIYINSELLPDSEIGSLLKLEVGAAIPIVNTSKEKVTIGGKIQNTSIEYVDKNVPFETDQIENFNSFSLKFTYQRSLNDNWALNVMGESQVASNFDRSEINAEDVFFNAMISLDKYNEEQNSIWTFGATYDIKYGLYFPIPIIAYTKRINEAWAYKIGLPESRVKWSFAENHNLVGFATLTGFTGNLNDEIEVYKEDYTGVLRQTSFVLGLGYEFSIMQKFKATLRGGHTVYNRMQLQNYNNDEIYDFDMANSFYVNVGVKFTFDNKTKTKSVY